MTPEIERRLVSGVWRTVLVDEAANGGSQPVDLGTVDLVDLLDGPQTLYTPDNSIVTVAFDLATAVAPDAHELRVIQDPSNTDPRYFLRLVNHLGAAQVTSQALFTAWVSDVPVRAGLVTGFSGYFLDEALGTWQADHLYTDKTCISAAGHIWSSTAGTSGGSTPDFAGNIGGTVVDNEVAWQDEGALPTTGSLRVYAIVNAV